MSDRTFQLEDRVMVYNGPDRGVIKGLDGDQAWLVLDSGVYVTRSLGVLTKIAKEESSMNIFVGVSEGREMLFTFPMEKGDKPRKRLVLLSNGEIELRGPKEADDDSTGI